MTEIDIRPLNPLDSEMVDQWLDCFDASITASLPGFPLFSRASRVVQLTRKSSSMKQVHLVAMIDDKVVGSTEVSMPLLDNLHMAEFELEVHPDHRRRGVGTALYREVERVARENDRRSLHIYVAGPLPGGGGQPRQEFAKAIAESAGFVDSLTEVRRVSDHEAVSPFDLDELLADAWSKAEGYELRQWINRTPEDLVDGIAYLDGRLLEDAPTGTLDIEPQRVDADRVNERERNNLVRGQLRLNTAVVHSESGRVAGWTDIAVNSTEEYDAWQGITIVGPDDRGHRIGTILKIENHRQLLRYRPQVRHVHTWNAAVNDHMISINEAIGYRAVDAWTAYEKKLDA
ncbi:GNAT family N-acetyltransferase [Stackebrandtia soli]|uniref:GNAT family N-acetyltransferase n=1 Tax=Stackebrandtia soli TaxID=1892856 RepID=UPI0039ECA4A4